MSAQGKKVIAARRRRRNLRNKARALHGRVETWWGVTEHEDRLVFNQVVSERNYGADPRTDLIVVNGERIMFRLWSARCARSIPIQGPRGVLP